MSKSKVSKDPKAQKYRSYEDNIDRLEKLESTMVVKIIWFQALEWRYLAALLAEGCISSGLGSSSKEAHWDMQCVCATRAGKVREF